MRIFWAIMLICFCGLGMAEPPVHLKNVRIWAAPDNTRVVFDLSGPVGHSLEILENPDRVVVDIPQTRLLVEPAQPLAGDKYLQQVRSAVQGQGDLRFLLDLKQKVKTRSFLLPPIQQYGHRLVVDLFGKDSTDQSKTVVLARPGGETRPVVIAIDAGHGGEDPGARGPGGVYEKDVVLEISKQLAEKINRERGMRAVLIRDGDYYLPLRKRIEKARQHQADLFISIHADAFRDSRVGGSSVYILSNRGASSEAARWLAERENASDLIGGVSLDVNDNVLASVLLDLSQTASLEASIDVAERVLTRLNRVGKVHKRRVQSAGFAVLKSPDIPSILIETAYISNPAEEHLLRDRGHQANLAGAIVDGLHSYFADHAPEGTLLASRKHVISRGDTLSGIAQQYRVSMQRLRELNGLQSDVIRVGQVLAIPAESGG